jgi:O-succinylbenzoate synthase
VAVIVESIDVFHVRMPLVSPFRTAFADQDSIESLLVRMRSAGLEGWGETAPLSPPRYSGEYTGGAFAVICGFLAPRLLGQDVASGAGLQELLRPIKGNFFAKAGLDLAWWDLYAQSRNEPLWKTLGGRGPTVDVGADFGVMDSIPQLLDEIGKAVDDGFQRIKLKYRPGWELNMISAVRKRFPDPVVHVDCNSAYTLNDLPMLRELDRFNLAMIEQPLAHDDLLDHAELARQLRTPICLDESVTTAAKAEQAARIGACRWINIKHGRVGGVTNALAVHKACRASGIANWVGGMGESAIAQAFTIALGGLDNVTYPCDIFPSRRFFRDDLGEPPLELSGPSQVTARAAPGIGVRPHPGRLKQWTLKQQSLR